MKPLAASLPIAFAVLLAPAFAFTETVVDFDSAGALSTHFNVSPTAVIAHELADGAGQVSLGTVAAETDLNVAIFQSGHTLAAGETYGISFTYATDPFASGYLSLGFTTASSVTAGQGGPDWDSTPPNAVASLFSDTAYAWRNNLGDPVAALAGQGDLGAGVSFDNTVSLSLAYQGAGTMTLSMRITSPFGAIGGGDPTLLAQTITLTNSAFTDGAVIRPFFGGDPGEHALGSFVSAYYRLDNFATWIGTPPVSIGAGQTTSLDGAAAGAPVEIAGGTATVTTPTTVATLTGTGTAQLGAPLTLGAASGTFNGTVNGPGRLVIGAGGYSLSGTVNTSLDVGADADVELDASVSGPVTVGGKATLREGTVLSGGLEAEGTAEKPAEVVIANGESVSFSSRFRVGPNSTFRLHGELHATSSDASVLFQTIAASMDGLIDSSVDILGVSLTVGSSPGLLAVTGDLSFDSDCTLEMELGGLVRGTGYDAIDVGETFTLGGLLQVTLIYGFTPQIGDSFNLFDASEFAGDFSLYQLPGLPAGMEWDLDRIADTGVLSVVDASPIPEPADATVAAALAGLCLAGLRRRRA